MLGGSLGLGGFIGAGHEIPLGIDGYSDFMFDELNARFRVGLSVQSNETHWEETYLYVERHTGSARAFSR